MGLISILCIVLSPSEKACYQMMAASIITPNNLETVGTTAENIIDYIIESVDHLLDENENENKNNNDNSNKEGL